LKRLIRDKSHPIWTKVPPAPFTQTCPTIHFHAINLQQLNGPLFADGGRPHKQAILLPPTSGMERKLRVETQKDRLL